MQPYAFINYRQSDSLAEARNLYDAMIKQFGDGCAFLDMEETAPGKKWPEHIRTALNRATVVLAVIGPNWLKAVDDYNRRRIDLPGDWVRLEIQAALTQGQTVIPVLVSGLSRIPPGDALPDDLQGLPDCQAMCLGSTSWKRDVEFLLQKLVETHAFKPAASRVPKSDGLAEASSLPDSIYGYLQRLVAETSHLTLPGLGRSMQIELPIEEAFVPLRTKLAVSMEIQRADVFKDARADHEEDVPLDMVFQKAAQTGHRGVVLLGEPGSGKTTVARQLAWRLASGNGHPGELGLPAGIVPVFLRFRNVLPGTLALKQGALRAFLEAETACETAPDDQKNPGPELWNLKTGLLWLLDGLDEIVDAAAQQTVAGWIRQAIKGRPNDWFVVTCRFAGYFRDGVPLGAKFAEFHVRPLDDGQVERFIRYWFRSAYRKLLKPDVQADETATKLREILSLPTFQTGHIRELATNPLLLTIMCIVFHEERQLTTGRAELYSHCVRVLLQHWRREVYDAQPTRQKIGYDAGAAEAVLTRVAWWMHQQQNRTAAPFQDLAAEAEKGLVRISTTSNLGNDGAAFLSRMRDEAGILAMTGEADGRCGFLHLSFQEYLAAEYAANQGLARELASRAADSWWREVALLSLRHSAPFCQTFFQEMLAAGIAENHPDLAERCLTESLYFAPEPFAQVLEDEHAPLARQAAVLRLLKERTDKVQELEPLIRTFAKSSHAELSGFAREILARLGTNVLAAATSDDDGLYVDEKTGITFVRIPAGEFQMGSERISNDEKPVHPVKIAHEFWLAKYPVTNAQYQRFLESARRQPRKPEYWGDRRFNQPDNPVVGINWIDAQAYCEWAGFRLPTEAEWEYACRAGTKTDYAFGNDEKGLTDHGWFASNSNGQTQPVGAKAPNAWGLHDMHGNVWEWCQDWYDPGYYANSPTVDPKGPSRGTVRLGRGGSWNGEASFCRSAYRLRVAPDYRYSILGFRVAHNMVEETATVALERFVGAPQQ